MDLINAAIPFFFVLIAAEFVIGRLQGRRIFRAPDVIADLSLGTLQTIFTVVAAGLLSGLYVLAYEHRFFTLPDSWWVVVFALVGVDFCYYWFHRASHRVMLAWATHAPHHSSEDYNFAVALRQGPIQPLCSMLFYLPLGLLGLPYQSFVFGGAVSLLYQFWIHTEVINRIGPLEWVLNTPSHHRVHHGCNGGYLDKNHGGILIIWDRLFGTFAQEHDTPIYGTVTALTTWNPLLAWWQPFGDIVSKMRASHGVTDILCALFAPPEWLPAGMASAPPVTGPRPKFDARPHRGVLIYGAVQFVVVLLLGVVYLRLAPQLSTTASWTVALWLTVSYGAIGGLLDERPWARPLEVTRLVVVGPLVWWLLRDLG